METAFFKFYNLQEFAGKTVSTSLVSLLISTVLFVVLGYLFIDPISNLISLNASYLKWVIAVIAVDALMVIPFAKMRAEGKPFNYALIKMFNVILSVGMTVLFFTTLPSIPELEQILPEDRIELFFIAFLAANVLTFALVSRVYFKSWDFDKELWKKMLSYGWPILLAGLAFAINETADKILLQNLLPLREEEAEAVVGVYTAGYRLAVGMTLFAQAFRLGVEPFFFSQAQQKNSLQQYALITKAFVVLGVITLMSYVVLVDLIKPLLVDDGFPTAMEIVPIILIAYLFSGIYQTLSVWYKINDKTIYGAAISGAAAVITILINIILIPQIGYIASAAATCVAYGLMMVTSYLMGRKHLAVPYEIRSMLLYLITGISLSCFFFYYVRDAYGIESLITYSIGAGMTCVLTLLILYMERDIVRSILLKKK